MMLLESDIIQAFEPEAIETVEAIQPLELNLLQLGGYIPMSIVTLLLIVLLLAAWKAPAWVKEIGLIALALGFLWQAICLIRCGNAIQSADADLISPNLMWMGVKCSLIPSAYCVIIYIVSLIIRIFRKPRG